MPPKKEVFKCTACSKRIKTAEEADLHPLINCLICSICCETYGTGDFATAWQDGIDEEGDDNYCRWCCDGGSLFGCMAEKGDDRCHFSFCRDCIERNVPDDPILQASDDVDFKWYCYACDNSKISKLIQHSENAMKTLNKKLNKPPSPSPKRRETRSEPDGIPRKKTKGEVSCSQESAKAADPASTPIIDSLIMIGRKTPAKISLPKYSTNKPVPSTSKAGLDSGNGSSILKTPKPTASTSQQQKPKLSFKPPVPVKPASEHILKKTKEMTMATNKTRIGGFKSPVVRQDEPSEAASHSTTEAGPDIRQSRKPANVSPAIKKSDSQSARAPEPQLTGLEPPAEGTFSIRRSSGSESSSRVSAKSLYVSDSVTKTLIRSNPSALKKQTATTVEPIPISSTKTTDVPTVSKSDTAKDSVPVSSEVPPQSALPDTNSNTTQSHSTERDSPNKVKLSDLSPDILKQRLEVYSEIKQECVREVNTRFDKICEMIDLVRADPSKKAFLRNEIDFLRKPFDDISKMVADLKNLLI